MTTTRTFTVGDRLTSLLMDLYEGDGVTPIVLGAAETVAFRMLNAATGAVKVNNQACVIVTRGTAATNTPAQARYDWAAADVDTAAEYVGWAIRTSGGQTEHFPSAQDHDDPEFKIIFKTDA